MRHGFSFGAACITLPAAAVNGCIAVQHFFPKSSTGCSNAVVFSQDGSEVENHQKNILSRFPLENETQHTRTRIIAIDPFETPGSEIEFVERGMAGIEHVQVSHPFLNACVTLLL